MRKLLIALSLLALPQITLADGMDSDARAALGEKSLKTTHASDDSVGNGTGTSGPRFEKASPEQQTVAVGHFARARSLLIAALNEFNAGARKASPESLIDVSAFRSSIGGKARELEKVLDPQPRVTEGGVKYDADTRLLKHKQ